MDDNVLRERLIEVDNDEDLNISQWEAEFIESVCFQYDGKLSDKQRTMAKRIAERYGY